jgi:uncharacterized membrane protein
MSGDYTRGSIGPDGRFEIHGLTPGGQYVLYADAIRAGGFPTDHPQILPGPEEFFNGGGENGEALKDDPCQSVMLEAVPGNSDEANIIFNRVKNGPSVTVIEAPGAFATDISGDGETVVGVFNGNAAPSFSWSEEDGFAVLGGTGGLARISQDGQHIVSNSVSPETSRVQASFWLGGTDWQPIPVVDDPGPGCSNAMGLTLTAATGISAHGEAVSALGYDGTCTKPRAFLWTESGGPSLLPVPDDTRQASANSLSADGNTVVGWRNLLTSGSRRAVRWSNGEFIQIDGGSDLVGEANGVNPDGSAIVGQYLGTAREAWRWTEENGVESIGSLGGPGIATDVSDSGNIVVGFSGTSNRMAFMWMPETGIFSLDGFLRSQGVALGNFGLFTATAISSDGSRITGWGTGPDNYYPWVVDLSKVVVTHAPPGNPSKARSIVVSFGSLQEHLAHGDTMGLTYR